MNVKYRISKPQKILITDRFLIPHLEYHPYVHPLGLCDHGPIGDPVIHNHATIRHAPRGRKKTPGAQKKEPHEEKINRAATAAAPRWSPHIFERQGQSRPGYSFLAVGYRPAAAAAAGSAVQVVQHCVHLYIFRLSKKTSPAPCVFHRDCGPPNTLA